jgi:hypothetical protein
MSTASRELLASRTDVWGFLAEPYHLSDWWPGIVAVHPDRRGFAPGARWRISAVEDPPRFGPIRFPRSGGDAGPVGDQTLVIEAIEPPERWAWQLIRPVRFGRDRTTRHRAVSVILEALADDRTRASLDVSSGGRQEPALARDALDRLYDLVQTAASS